MYVCMYVYIYTDIYEVASSLTAIPSLRFVFDIELDVQGFADPDSGRQCRRDNRGVDAQHFPGPPMLAPPNLLGLPRYCSF